MTCVVYSMGTRSKVSIVAGGGGVPSLGTWRASNTAALGVGSIGTKKPGSTAAGMNTN